MNHRNPSAASFPPDPDLQEPGIHISAMPYLRGDGANSIALRGVFRWSPEQTGVAPTRILETIAVVLTFGPEHLPASFPPGKETILLEDDLKRVGNDLVGTFQIDVFEEAGVMPLAGRYFLSAAMASYLSNVCEVNFSGP